MPTAFNILILAFLLASCNDKKPESENKVRPTVLDPLPISSEKVKGTYIGDFKGSPIAITFNYVTDNHASGYNIHKGLTRNISGSIEIVKGKLHLQVAEPGNNKYDGKFDLVIDTAKWTGDGIFEPFQQGNAASFHFKRQPIAENLNEYDDRLMDSLGNYITLLTDGSCTYTYLSDTTNTGQQLTVHGNYTRDNKNLIIYWQKNSVFLSPKSIFRYQTVRPDPNEDYSIKTATGEGKVFKEMIEF